MWTLRNYYIQDAFQALYILSSLRRQSQCCLIFTNEEIEAKKKMWHSSHTTWTIFGLLPQILPPTPTIWRFYFIWILLVFILIFTGKKQSWSGVNLNVFAAWVPLRWALNVSVFSALGLDLERWHHLL